MTQGFAVLVLGAAIGCVASAALGLGPAAPASILFAIVLAAAVDDAARGARMRRGRQRRRPGRRT